MSWKVPEWQFSLAMKTGSALSECPQMAPGSAQDHGITLCGWVSASGHLGKVTFLVLPFPGIRDCLWIIVKGLAVVIGVSHHSVGSVPWEEQGNYATKVIGFLWSVLFLSLIRSKDKKLLCSSFVNLHMLWGLSWFVFWTNKELVYLLISSHFFVADLGLRSCPEPVWEDIFVLLLLNITAHSGTVGILI